MTGIVATVRGTAAGLGLNLRRAPLSSLFRRSTSARRDRDFWVDEAAINDRFRRVLGRARRRRLAVAGCGPVRRRRHGLVTARPRRPRARLARAGRRLHRRGVLDGGDWPSDDDYGGGDFDTYNESRRARFADLRPAELVARRHRRARACSSRSRVGCPGESIRSDAAWGWVYQVLHGHALDHLRSSSHGRMPSAGARCGTTRSGRTHSPSRAILPRPGALLGRRRDRHRPVRVDAPGAAP